MPCYLGGGVMAAIYKGLNGTEFGAGGVLLIVDAEGNDGGIIDESVWNNYSSGMRAMLVDNSKIIIAGSIADSPDYNSKIGIWKLEGSGDLVWSQTFGPYPPQNSTNRLNTLVKTMDGHYVCTSDHYYYTNDSHFDVRVIKADSADGSLIWERYYHFVESESEIHSAIDLKATPDGGVVFCGHASDSWAQNPNLELPAQQGWIVKLDACGCLVPGCDINCTVGVEESANSEERKELFLVGPNPASDYINIYLAASNPSLFDLSLWDIRNSKFVIHDMNGNEVKSFALQRADTTYIVDTQGMAAGEYIISLVSEGNVLQTERIVVAK